MSANTQGCKHPVNSLFQKVLRRSMKQRLVPLFLGVLAFSVTSAPAETILKPEDRIAICGDSITEQKLYSAYIEDYLRVCQPAKVSTMQFGWGGETSWGFEPRMAHDVLTFQPTLATTCFGMNDGGYSQLREERETKYRAAMASIIKQFKDAGVRVVVGSPGVVDSFTYRKDPEQAIKYNQTLSQLRDICKQLAQENGVVFADVFGAMNDAMTKAKEKYGKEYPLAGDDGVHPGPNGHLVMAYAFLKAMGVDGNIGEIKVDLSSGEATASDGHKVDSSQGGVVSITSTRFPFCFYGDDLKDQSSTKGATEFVPFNQDLNRLMLVVSGGNADKVKVTWGKSSKEFAATDLAKGINLAAEFMNNPFSDAFAAVDVAVRAKQSFETQVFKNLIPGMRTIIDEDSERAGEKIVIQAAVQQWRVKDDAVNGAIKPVTHIIKIEEVK